MSAPEKCKLCGVHDIENWDFCFECAQLEHRYDCVMSLSPERLLKWMREQIAELEEDDEEQPITCDLCGLERTHQEGLCFECDMLVHRYENVMGFAPERLLKWMSERAAELEERIKKKDG